MVPRWASDRVLFAEGLNVRMLPRFAPCVAFWLVLTRLPKLFICRAAGTPALGRMLLPPRAANAALERPPAGTAPTWLRCMACRRLDCCCWNETGRVAVPRADPKKCCAPPLRMVDGAAARPLADKLACVGTTGKLPAIMRAPFNCSRVADIAPTLPAPKRPALTADIPRPTRPSRMFATFE